MNSEDLVALNEQIVAMAKTGLPLDQGLESLARDMSRGRLKATTQALAADLRAGHPLPEAIERQKDIPPYYACLVTAGVQSGQLAQVLTTLASYARTMAITRASIVEALFYPLVILFIGSGLFGVLTFFVLPRFDQLFQEMGLALPALTRLVLEVTREPALYVGLPLGLLAGGLLALKLWSMVSDRGRRFATRVLYRVPLVGRLVESARLQAFTELLGILVRYGTPLPRAFQLAGEANTDLVIRERSQQIAANLEKGTALGEAIQSTQLLPQWLIWVAGSGEAKSDLAGALVEIAEFYRRRVGIQILVLRSILPPLIVLMIGGVLSVVFGFAVMTPMIKLLEGLSK